MLRDWKLSSETLELPSRGNRRKNAGMMPAVQKEAQARYPRHELERKLFYDS